METLQASSSIVSKMPGKITTTGFCDYGIQGHMFSVLILYETCAWMVACAWALVVIRSVLSFHSYVLHRQAESEGTLMLSFGAFFEVRAQ